MHAAMPRLPAHVVLCARDRALLDETLSETRSGRAIALDLRLPESARALVDFARTAHILIDNAGATKRGEFAQLREADWIDGFALKFFAASRARRGRI
jgi:short-subunit dehydrogenase